jgi:alanine-glyoxylate transaminase/serine-glyoxylate transaminase/serine-pyruvate transaminase
MHLKLMIPGPVEVEEEVLEWMGAPVHVHYGDEWVAIHNETIVLLQQACGTTGRVFMLPGSGSLAADTAVQSVFAPGQKVALGINGHFGKRWLEILQANGVEPVIIETAPDQPLDPAVFDHALTDDPAIVGVAAVHLETSTALLNPIREIAAVARAHNRLCMVDAVASLGGTPLPMDEWGVDVVASASQKGLGGAPGLGIVALNDRAWEAVMRQPERPRSWYLDLRRWQWYVENWGDWHPFPVTMPCSVVLGLRAALQSLMRDGLDARLKRYERIAAHLRAGLEALGMKLFVTPDLMTPVLTAVYCPPNITSGELVRYLANEHHIKITGGFGPYKEQVIRIGHMGNVIDIPDVDQLLAALRQFLTERQALSL